MNLRERCGATLRQAVRRGFARRAKPAGRSQNAREAHGARSPVEHSTATRTPLAALAIILAATAAWWALALWPAGPEAPPWLARTRDACFGVKGDALPGAGGWLLLVGQPVGMLGLLIAAWGVELRAGLARLMARAAGQIVIGAAMAALVAGVAGAAVRVRAASQEPFSAGAADLAAQLTRVNDAAPPLALTDQAGRQVTLESYRGRAVLVSFAYAHCQTVCPLVVSDVLRARGRAERNPPAVVIVTLDPWRDTPSRLPSIARLWQLPGDAHVLSGPPDVVDRTLNQWRVPRTRNQKTGNISHPSIVYVIGPDGRIAYVVPGNADVILAAVQAL